MEVRTLRGSSAADIESALRLFSSEGFAPRLAIVFASVAHATASIGRIFQEAGLDVFGATTAGEILATDGEDCVFDDSVVALLLDLDPSAYRLRLFEAGGRTSAELGREVGIWAKQTFAAPALLTVGSGMRSDGEQIVHGIVHQVGEGVPIFGGMAGDGLRSLETFVFDGDRVSSEGVLALAIDSDRVEVRGLAACGWRPLGVDKVITRSEGNVVYTIDDMPALDVYSAYLGVDSVDLSSFNIAECPLQLVRDGYSVLRAALIADPQTRSLIFTGSVPQGARVRFSTAPGPEISEVALEAMRGLRDAGTEADALLLFSCAARRFVLGPLSEDEIRPIQQLWGVPMVGFFTYGEIGSVERNPCEFHNETCVLVALHER